MADQQKLKDRLPQPGNAVERVEVEVPAGTAPAAIRKAIETQVKGFEAVMPSGLDHERFARLVLTAVKATPKLMECFGTVQGQTSVLLAAMDCAGVGLEPNTPTQDAWLLPRWNGQTKTLECELSIGYRGYVKLARRSGIVKSIRAEVVREKDSFHYEYGLDEDVLKHVPYDGDEDPGALTHAYAVVRFTNGGSQFVVLSRRQVEKRRAMSSSWSNEKARKYSPWSTWEDEMWKKSAIRALVPFLELRTEEAARLERDERPLAIKDGEIVTAELPAAAVEEPFEEAPAAARGSDPDLAEPAVIIDPETGKIVKERHDDPPSDFEPMTDAQNRALHVLLKKKYKAEGDLRHAVVGNLLDRDIESLKEVSKDEASRLIDQLQEMADEA